MLFIHMIDFAAQGQFFGCKCNRTNKYVQNSKVTSYGNYNISVNPTYLHILGVL